MAQKRLVSPDYWTDRNIIGLSPWARLFYIGTWNYACDNGHILFDPFELKLKILPADPVDENDIVNELVAAGRLVRATTDDGKPYLWAPSLSRHQKAETRWKSRCSVCRTTTNHDEPRPNSAEHDETPRTTTKLAEPRRNSPTGEVRGEEVSKGEGREQTPPPRKCPKHVDNPDSPACGACRDARLAREDWDEASAAVRALPVRARDCAVDGHKFAADGYCVLCGARSEAAAS